MKITTASRTSLVLGALGLAELAFALFAARVVGRESTYPVYLTSYLAMGVCWLGACYAVVTAKIRPHRAVVILIAVALRVPFLASAPSLSDDIFRYIWDGRVQHAGINPYRYAPEEQEVAFLRDGHEQNFQGINNKDIPTIYPPFMEMAFFVATTVSESVLWMKLFFVFADLALVFLLAQLLESLSLNPARALIYAWSPLVVVEIAGNGHNDVLGVLFLMAALAAIVRHRGRLSMFYLALSGFAKIVGITLTPLFLRSIRLRDLWVMPVVTVLLALPYASAGSLAFRGLTQYGLRWRGNDSVFHILYYFTDSLDIAKILVGVFLVVMVLVLVALGANPLRSSYLTVSAILLLTTTVHPWYVLWIAPFLVIYASPAWLFLSLSVGLAYHSAYLATPGQAWQDTLWVKLVEYAPFFVLALASVWRRRSAWRTQLGLNSAP